MIRGEGDFDDSLLDDKLLFEYGRAMETPELFALSPSNGAPGTKLTLYGRRFVDSQHLACVFGALRVPAHLVSPSVMRTAASRDGTASTAVARGATAVQCVVPRELHRVGECVDVRVANDQAGAVSVDTRPFLVSQAVPVSR